MSPRDTTSHVNEGPQEKFTRQPSTKPDGVRFPSTLAALVQVYTGLGELDAPYASVIVSVPHLGHDVFG